MPMDAPAGLITEVTRFARMLTRRIVVDIDQGALRLERFDDAAVDIMSMRAPALSQFERRRTNIGQLNERICRAGRMLAIEGCDQEGQLALAHALRPAYLGGLTVGPETRTLSAPYLLALKLPSRPEREPADCAGFPL